MKRDLVLRLQHETEGMRGGESVPLGNLGFQVWLYCRVVVWPWQRATQPAQVSAPFSCVMRLGGQLAQGPFQF